MSRNARIALVLAAVAVAVIAFLVVSPGGDDDDSPAGSAATGTVAETEAETEPRTVTETEAEPPRQPAVTRIRIAGGAVTGGPQRIEAATGETVGIVVTSDAPDEIHLHGYDITMNAAPGSPARFSFRADLEGVFEMESHAAEDAGMNPLVAELVVEPS